jgi:hypothetical protein
MKRSGDQAGQRSGDQVTGRSGDRNQNPTTETQRHGETGTINAFTVEALRRGEGIESQPRTELCVPREFRHSSFDLLPRFVDQNEKGRNDQDARGWFRYVMHVFREAMREIFDENAYDRFLQRTHSARSVESYSSFLREREAGIARKPRCC